MSLCVPAYLYAFPAGTGFGAPVFVRPNHLEDPAPDRRIRTPCGLLDVAARIPPLATDDAPKRSLLNEKRAGRCGIGMTDRPVAVGLPETSTIPDTNKDSK